MKEQVNLFTVRRTEERPPRRETVADIPDFHAAFPMVANPYCAADSLSLERENRVITYPGRRPLETTARDAGESIDDFISGFLAGMLSLLAGAGLLIGAVLL